MKRAVVIALRVLLGLVFLYAAWTKLQQPWLVFALSIDAYRLLPSWAVFTVARTLPWLELAFGLLLLSGVMLRYASLGSAVLLAFFYAAMIWAYVAGSGIDCGCFGVGEAVSLRTLARDGFLLAAAVVLVVLSRRPHQLSPRPHTQLAVS